MKGVYDYHCPYIPMSLLKNKINNIYFAKIILSTNFRTLANGQHIVCGLPEVMASCSWSENPHDLSVILAAL